MSDHELDDLLSFAADLAHQAGRLTLDYFQRPLEVERKSDDSPVTIADRETELLIRRSIERKYPSHGILGEEFGTKEPSAGCPWLWVIDPIDGTKSFICGVPLYATLLALMCEDRSVVGVIELPALGDQLSAAEGLGCRHNGRPAHVSSVDSLSEAVGLTTDPLDLERAFPDGGWRTIWNGCKFRRTWGDAYGHFLVATGRAEFMLDARLAPYDCAALPVILREAGGAFFDWTGCETIYGRNGISTNAALKNLVLSSLKPTHLP